HIWEVPMSAPRAPRGMTAEERKVWRLVAADVDDSPVAVELLRAWCASVVELRRLEEWVAEHGTVLELFGMGGHLKSKAQAPEYVQVRALRADLVRLADALGLTPSSRAVGDGAKEAANVDDPLAEVRKLREARLRGAEAAG